MKHLFKYKRFLILFIYICLAKTAFAQSDNKQIDDARLSDLIQKVLIKSKKTRDVGLNEYQYNYKQTVEFEETNKISTKVYEEYCVDTGKPVCGIVLVEEDGVRRSESKIKKDREKISKLLMKNNSSKNSNPFGYGLFINSIWVDPGVYLKDCKVFSYAEKIVEDRNAVLLRVGDCNIDDEPGNWKSRIDFMLKTEAEIWIDEKDEDVIKMHIYAKKEFASPANPDNPVIIFENMRVENGYWLSKKIRMETTGNKTLFPSLKDNWQYEFFDYRKLTVNVSDTKLSAN